MCISMSLFWLAALAPVSPGGGHDDVPLAYADLARAALEDGGRADATPDTFDFAGFLGEAFVHTRLGLFDLYMPASAAAQESAAADYASMAAALVDAQDRWLEWLRPASREASDALADVKQVRAWLRSWRPEQLAQGVRDGGRETTAILPPKPTAAEAAERFSDFMIRGRALGLDRQDGTFEPIVLVPERRQFVELVSLGGWLYPSHRATYWQPGIASWLHCYIDEYQFFALQYRGPGDYTSGVSMSSRTPTGVAQQIVQLSMGALLDNYYGERIPPALAGALAVNLVIDLYGECNTRVDGDLRSRRTEAREIFIAGGASEGGVLPPDAADSRWREKHGAGRFADVLRLAQEAGAEDAPRGSDRVRHFELQDDRGLRRTVVSGPFLGEAAAGSALAPAAFFGDQLEFLRAYRTCFTWWLQTKAAGSATRSSESFAELLVALAQRAPGGPLDASFAGAYESAPLSDPELGKKDLEGRFLRWLSKQ